MVVATDKSASATAIRPFAVELPQSEIDALRSPIAATRWPEKETVADQSPASSTSRAQLSRPP